MEIKVHVRERNARDAVEPETGRRLDFKQQYTVYVVTVLHVLVVDADEELQDNVDLHPGALIETQIIQISAGRAYQWYTK